MTDCRADCAFSGQATARYGIPGQYVYALKTNGTQCSNDIFGDPAVGPTKNCGYSTTAVATDYIDCATENGFCAFAGQATVRYGTADSYVYQTLTGGTVCDNATFGDPAYGSVKNCAYHHSADTGPTVNPPTIPVTPPLVTSSGGDIQKRFCSEALLRAAQDNDVNSVDAILNDMAAAGTKWVCLEFQWNTINPGSPYNVVFGPHELAVSHALTHGIQVLGLVDYSNGYANGGQEQNHPPSDVGQFGTYAGSLAAHFGPLGVHTWEIWNEENTQNYGQPGVDSA